MDSAKLPNSQLNKSNKSYPIWLRDNATNLKQLPGIYQGVLGQVQLQADFLTGVALKNASINNDAIRLVRNSKKNNPVEYMNSFTDTERVKQLLSMSHLPNETLATIWAHVNKTFPGRLTNREVCLALALVALFQRLESDGKEYRQVAGQSGDPFNQLRVDKKAPVPKFYSNNSDNLTVKGAPNHRMTTSNSVPDELNSTKTLLIDIGDDNESYDQIALDQKGGDRSRSLKNISSNEEFLTGSVDYNSINLIDTDGNRPELFLKQAEVWLKVMSSLKAVFKRTFDILNVENGRQSALEALGSNEGKQFCKNLCLCYPIAHNIKQRIDQLVKRQLIDCMRINRKYIEHMNDLMISINEYWAVLINLFHESGQTSFIELIMDSLNGQMNEETMRGQSGDQPLDELDSIDRADLCSICRARFYLARNTGAEASKRFERTADELQVALDQELHSEDGHYYYHAKCANFWLNNTESGRRLPFERRDDGCDILKPTSA